jgi:hypothetical protein
MFRNCTLCRASFFGKFELCKTCYTKKRDQIQNERAARQLGEDALMAWVVAILATNPIATQDATLRFCKTERRRYQQQVGKEHPQIMLHARKLLETKETQAKIVASKPG